MKYRRFFEYYAIFENCEEGGFAITFPDLPGAISQGDDMDDALYMAADCIEGYLKISQDDGEEIPEPSTKEEIERIAKADPDIDGEYQVVLIRADLKKLYPELDFLEPLVGGSEEVAQKIIEAGDDQEKAIADAEAVVRATTAKKDC